MNMAGAGSISFFFAGRGSDRLKDLFPAKGPWAAQLKSLSDAPWLPQRGGEGGGHVLDMHGR